MYPMSQVTCHVSRVTCHMSLIFVFYFLFFCSSSLEKVVELVGGGFVINGAIPSSSNTTYNFSYYLPLKSPGVSLRSGSKDPLSESDMN